MHDRSLTINSSIIRNRKRIKKETANLDRLTPFESYIACIKGYVGVSLLFIPKAFGNGGIVFSVCCVCFSCLITTVCGVKLI